MATENDNNQAVVEVPEEGVVTIELEGGSQTTTETPAEGEGEKKVETTPRVRIKDPPVKTSEEDKTRANLEQTLANERRLRQNAEQNANSERQRAEQLAKQKQQSDDRARSAQETADVAHLSSIENGIASATSQMETAQKDVATYMEAGQFEKVAEAQTRLSRASAKLDRLEADKENFTAQKAARDAATETDDTGTTTTTSTAPPLEQYISQMAPPAQKWMREHPDCIPASFGGDDAKNAKMLSGHYSALGQGFKANSDEYFRVIEESLGLRQAATTETEEEDEPVEETKPAKKTTPEPQQQRQREARPSAPASRAVPGAPQTGGSRTVRLSMAEQEAARFSYPHMEPQKAYAEYAKNKVQLESEGKLGRTTH